MFDAPASGANFLTALNGKLSRLQGLAAEYRMAAQSVEEPEVKLRRLRDLSRQMNALSWLVPVPPATGGQEAPTLYESLIEAWEWMNKAVEGLEALGVELRRSLRTIIKVTGWLTKADQAAQTMLKARRAGLPSSAVGAWGGLALALSLVPVLGEAYGRIVTEAP
ncbi:MAG: hypothetical protein ACPL88_00060, partial [Bryobacteraceae bacterium]